MEVDLTEGVHTSAAGPLAVPRLTRLERQALESAHQALRRAELRARRPVLGRLARRSLEDARAGQQEVLDRLGLDSYEGGVFEAHRPVRAERPPTRAVLIALWHAAEAAQAPAPRVVDLCPVCDRLMELTFCSDCRRLACADCLPHVADPRGGWLCVPCALLFAGVRVRPPRTRLPAEPAQR
jgi:hypothetical protein